MKSLIIRALPPVAVMAIIAVYIALTAHPSARTTMPNDLAELEAMTTADSSIGPPNGAHLLVEQEPVVIDGSRYARPEFAFVAVPVGSREPNRRIFVRRFDCYCQLRTYWTSTIPLTDTGFAIIPVAMDGKGEQFVEIRIEGDPRGAIVPKMRVMAIREDAVLPPIKEESFSVESGPLRLHSAIERIYAETAPPPCVKIIGPFVPPKGTQSINVRSDGEKRVADVSRDGTNWTVRVPAPAPCNSDETARDLILEYVGSDCPTGPKTRGNCWEAIATRPILVKPKRP